MTRRVSRSHWFHVKSFWITIGKRGHRWICSRNSQRNNRSRLFSEAVSFDTCETSASCRCLGTRRGWSGWWIHCYLHLYFRTLLATLVTVMYLLTTTWRRRRCWSRSLLVKLGQSWFHVGRNTSYHAHSSRFQRSRNLRWSCFMTFGSSYVKE